MMKRSTEADYHRRIARVMETILANPAAPHTVESLAEVAHLSPFHFHRLYRALTGESIAETVRRVRLAQAAHRLVDEQASVIHVALDVGYESPQAFARAFRGFAGVTPSEFQAHHQEEARSGVKVREMPSLAALCVVHDGPIATIPQSFRRLQALSNRPAGAPLVGLSQGDPEEAGGFRYLAGFLCEGSDAAIAGTERIEIPGGLYGLYRLVGPYALIAPTIESLFGGWLPLSGYEPDDRPIIELYRNAPAEVARQDLITDLLIPVR